MKDQPKIISLKDVRRYMEMPLEERRQMNLIALAKAQFSSIECIYRQRMEMNAISPDEYRKIVNEAERTRDTRVAQHTLRLEEIRQSRLD